MKIKVLIRLNGANTALFTLLDLDCSHENKESHTDESGADGSIQQLSV